MVSNIQEVILMCDSVGENHLTNYPRNPGPPAWRYIRQAIEILQATKSSVSLQNSAGWCALNPSYVSAFFDSEGEESRSIVLKECEKF